MSAPQRLYAVRSYYLSEADEIVALDSRLMAYPSAKRLLARLKRPDSEALDAEMLRWKDNCLKPSHTFRKVKRLDEHRLNRVSGMRTFEQEIEPLLRSDDD